ncbi:MAG: hypothetical protein JWQ72_3832, partial [Polaromonas sp.]|nr:hypothetical protein [Polaromonas sp.]
NGMATTRPVFELASSNVPSDVTGKLLVVGGVSYTVVLPQPDGTGNTVLILEAA